MEKKLDAEEILKTLAELRKSIPYIDEVAPPWEATEGPSTFPDGVPVETEEDFEYAAVLDALESMAADVEATVEKLRARTIEAVLEIYYIAENLAQDPANANLLPYVQELRDAYERAFGTPIPPWEGEHE